MNKKLEVKTYHSNATVYGEEKFLDIRYDGDYLACYYGDPYNNEDEAIEEYREDIRAEIKEAFPGADDDNIEDVVLRIMIHASSTISAMWK